MSRPLGFSNNYALGMRKDVAAAQGHHARSPTSRATPTCGSGSATSSSTAPDGWPG